jgi:hypothetical protein
MFCPKCRCEFAGWSGRCPTCGIPLVDEAPPATPAANEPVSYQALVDLVKEKGGRLDIDLSATDIGTVKKHNFPYFGYGYAWCKRMQGAAGAVAVDLASTEVGMAREQGFPYRGYGFAWVKVMQGHVGGNEITLTAVKAARKKTWEFPYFGFGRAWTETMTGRCGDQLRAELTVTDVGTRAERGFPYLGYGFAWENKAILALILDQ